MKNLLTVLLSFVAFTIYSQKQHVKQKKRLNINEDTGIESKYDVRNYIKETAYNISMQEMFITDTVSSRAMFLIGNASDSIFFDVADLYMPHDILIGFYGFNFIMLGSCTPYVDLFCTPFRGVMELNPYFKRYINNEFIMDVYKRKEEKDVPAYTLYKVRKNPTSPFPYKTCIFLDADDYNVHFMFIDVSEVK